MSDRVNIPRLSSGVPGFDEVLGGGIPEFSFNLILGGPGCGKTTLGHQVLFANASPERPAIYFTIVGEPPLKMLRYQQQFSFFDAAKVGDGSVRFIHLGQQALHGGLSKVLEAITQEVERSNPGVVVVDSFRSVVRGILSKPDGETELTDFVQNLARFLTSCQATTFLLGEYAEGERESAVFTVADGLVWLHQTVDRNSIVRKLHVMKVRGQGQIPGLHTTRITESGFKVFPRILEPPRMRAARRPTEHRLATGTPGLDELLGGGIPEGYSVLVGGPTGSGKTVLGNQFLLEGVRNGENGVVAVFERRPSDYLQTTPYGEAFEKMVQQKRLEVLYLRPLDLSIDETLQEIQDTVKRLGAKRAVIDSLSGLELALAPTFREDFRESLYRMLGALTGLGVTVVATIDLADSYVDLRFSPHDIAFLTDAVIIQRYVEIHGQLRRVLAVAKVRASPHSNELREYEIASDGRLVVGGRLPDYVGLLTGAPVLSGERGK